MNVLEIAERLLARLDAGERIVVATAVAITGSAPRGIGTSMALTADGTVIGSISGGCVEGAVLETCERVARTGAAELTRFGYDDAAAFAVGLSCGGRIEVLVQTLGADDASAVHLDALRDAAAGRSAALSLALDEPRLGAALPTECAEGRSFTDRITPPARMIVFGAVEFSVALSTAAAAVGFEVTICDPRAAFATAERFPAARHVVVDWPPDYLAQTAVDDRTVICVLSHDDRADVDLIAEALCGPAAYIGALGSRATQERRAAELAGRGIRDLRRLHAPIGLDIGAVTPEETAVSILAEVLAARSGRAGGRLTDSDGAIRGRAASEVTVA